MLAQNRLASKYETKEKVRRLLDELSVGPPNDVMADASERGREFDLWEMAGSLAERIVSD